MATVKQKKILQILATAYQGLGTALAHSNNFELLVAVILSAIVPVIVPILTDVLVVPL